MTPIQWIPWSERAKARISRGAHVMTGKIKRIPWPYCTRCGLLALRNDATRAALRRECVIVEDD